MPKRKWTKEEFTILRGSEPYTVQGYTHGPVGADKRESGTWFLTHLSSGYYIGMYNLLKDIRATVDRLLVIAPEDHPFWKQTGALDAVSTLGESKDTFLGILRDKDIRYKE